jgi:hypothetical protein
MPCPKTQNALIEWMSFSDTVLNVKGEDCALSTTAPPVRVGLSLSSPCCGCRNKSNDADTLTALYQRLHGLSFGPPDSDLGQARVATRADGTLVGIGSPLPRMSTRSRGPMSRSKTSSNR